MSKKTQDALRKYYNAFNYDTGVKAYKRGGKMGFTTNKFPWGGPTGNTWIPEIDNATIDESFNPDGSHSTDYYIRQYWNEHPEELFRTKGINDSVIADWKSRQGAGTNWSGLVGSVGSIIGGTISDFNDMNAKRDSISRGIALHGQGAYDNISDNLGLISAANNMTRLGQVNQKDIRNKSWGEDIGSSLMNGLNAGLSTGNVYVGLGVAAADFGKNLYERFHAREIAEELEKQRIARNNELNRQLYTASQRVDSNNDFLRMMSYYGNPFEYALGGEMRSHGSDWNNGLTFINAGGRHEDNPYEGVPSGVDDGGVPNLVEEGEVIWNDEYVFSDRLKVPEALSKKYKLGGEKTFAEAIEEVTKESRTRPNDPISNETNRAIVNEFMDAQEELREREQAKAAQQLQTAYDEDFMNQLAVMAPQGQMPADMGGIQIPQQGMVGGGAPVEGMPPEFAFGGNKFEDGSWKKYFTTRIENGTTIYTSPDGVDFYSEAGAKKHYDLNGESWLIPSGVRATNTPVSRSGMEYNDVVEPAYSTDGKQFKGYRIKGEKQIYGSREGAVNELQRRQAVKETTARYSGSYIPIDEWQFPEVAPSRRGTRDPEVNISGYATGNINNRKSGKTKDTSTSRTVRTGIQASMPISDYGFSGGLFQPTSITADTLVNAPLAEPEQPAQTTQQAPAAQAPVQAPAPSQPSTQRRPSSNASTGSTPRRAKGSEVESRDLYKSYIARIDSLSSEDKAKFVENINKSLPEGKKVKDYADWKKKANDGVGGPVHDATWRAASAIGQLESPSNRLRIPNTSADVQANLDALYGMLPQSEDEGIRGRKTQVLNNGVTPSVNDSVQKGLFGNTPWERLAPIYGTGVMAGNSILNGPDYYNADRIIDAARAVGVPVNIPVQTIGDYRTRRPFDERYLVNMANQNMAAGQRSLYNTSGGNRAMDMLGAMSLAHSNQQTLADIMRQAYLANRADDAQVAEFNRGTNLQNMSAINQRNQAQASLNSQRQTAMLNGLASGYGMRQSVWKDWRDDRDANIEAFIDNLGLRGREKMTDEMALSFAKEMGYNWTYDPNTGKITFVNPSSKGGNKKKRRF